MNDHSPDFSHIAAASQTVPDVQNGPRRWVIIGAGPGGLTAAYELGKRGHKAVVLEKDQIVGGIARTATYKNYRFDIGGHRFFTKVDSVQRMWVEILGSDFLKRRRLSRIYYNAKFFSYPLEIKNALFGLGLIETARVAGSLLRMRIAPLKKERTFEEWITNRFGRRLFQIFFKTYTEKVWGIPCSELSSDWAAQRIKNLDLVTAVKNALFHQVRSRKSVVTSLIEEFHYPRLGPGMMWERCKELVAEKGIPSYLENTVVRITHDKGYVSSVTVRDRHNDEREEKGTDFISSMPLRELIYAFFPAPPPHIIAAVARLRYRDFLIVVLIVDEPEVFPDQWIYIHSPDVKVGRVQNFKNWSPDMVPDPSKSSLGLEYFLWHSDDLWNQPDDALIALATSEATKIGLVAASKVIDGCVVRMPKAYPVYDEEYAGTVSLIRDYLQQFRNLHSIGRNGQHRYNNQDHSMLTAMYAVRSADGEDLDCWQVNADDDYHEEIGHAQAVTSERLTPRRLSVTGSKAF